jgi:hypothetical protein
VECVIDAAELDTGISVMSLSSTIFQLHGSLQDAREALGRTPGGGVLLTHQESWVALIVDYQDFPDAHEPLLIARVDFAEDIGLWLQFFRRGERVGALTLEWCPIDDEVDSSPKTEVTDGLFEWLMNERLVSVEHLMALQALVRDFDRRSAEPTDVAETVGVLLEFPIMFGHFELDIDLVRRSFPNADDVEGT